MRLNSAELNPRLSHRFLLRKAFANQVRSVALKVELPLFPLHFQDVAPSPSTSTRKELSQKIHICSEVVRRILAINDAMGSALRFPNGVGAPGCSRL